MMSLPGEKDAAASPSSCVACDRPDSDENMVACDGCECWYHFSCADVDESVSGQPWKCESCGIMNQTPIPTKNIRKANGKEGGKRLTVPTGAKKSSKVSVSSKGTSRRSKKSAAGDDVSLTSSARARLALELRMLDEDEQIKEQELQAELELKNKKLMLQKQNRERELALEAKQLAEEKAFQERQLEEEEKGRKALLQMKRLSLEAKKNIVRQFSQRGSDVSSLSESEKSSEAKVRSWLQKSGEQTEGIVRSTSAARGSSHVPEITGKVVLDEIRNPISGAAKKVNYLFEEIPGTTEGDKNDGDSVCNVQQQAFNDEIGPTSRQLAARQVMGKDLPTFSGNPEEWPIWISNFERSTATCGFSMDENLIRLQRCLKGQAMEMVRCRLLSPASVPHVIKALQMRYGRPETLIRALTEKIRLLAPPNTNDLESIVDFGMAVDSLVEHLKSAKQQAHLANPSLLHDLVAKLPVDYRLKWSAYKSTIPVVNLGTFGAFMSTLVELAYEVMDDQPTGKTTKGAQKPKDRSFVYTHSEYSSNEPTLVRPAKKVCAACKMEGHKIADCFNFKAMNIDNRLQIVSQNSLCRTCLNQHGKWPCKTWKGCEVEGCRLRHHTLLHTTTPAVPLVVSTSHSQLLSGNSPIFRILPVTLYAKDRRVNVFAFVDEGSQISLLDVAVAEQLGVTGPASTLSLQWTGNVTREEANSRVIQMEVSGGTSNNHYKIMDARTVEGLQLPTQSLHYQDLAGKYPHLRGLPIIDYENVTPKLLIGLDNLKLTIPLKIREGGWGQPMAAKCRLGWSIYGSSRSATESFTCGFHVGGWTNSKDDLNQIVRDFITLDNSGVQPPLAPLESKENKRAQQLLQTTTRRVGSRFETGLLWKWDEIQLPDSYGMALRRLHSLEKRLGKEPLLYDSVRQQIREYKEKGYTHQATEEELANTSSGKSWYLPLGIVLNPRKPNKVRIIWDAAAQVNGVSLNSVLLKGPDYLASLIEVFYHFRLYAVALTGDIKEMFHRLYIRREDRQFQRFLWRDDVKSKVQVFVMDVSIFGATCSPSSAQYVKNVNAKEFESESPRAAAAITRYHYVDDYLDSFPTAAEAVQVGSEVRRVHAAGGFEIRNFLSNDPTVAATVGAISNEAEKKINPEKEDIVESVLGMKWIPTGDDLTYSFVIRADLGYALDQSHKPSKREVLRVVMSLFDPLGLISYFIIHGKTLMQDIWASGVDWDEPVSTELCEQWWRWTAHLPGLNSIRIPRCYFAAADYQSYSSLQIHVFVDASKSAYACVVYFRVESEKGPEVALVAGKAKVAPLKLMSVPRLELQAAVLGTRLLNSVVSLHDLPVSRRVLWTDSQTVLAWLRSDHRRYQQFVGFRVAEILSSTDVQEWRKIDTELNVADLATKWGKGPNFERDNPWFRGPKFLLESESFWPKQEAVQCTTNEEIRHVGVHVEQTVPLIEVGRFSSWDKLHRITAYVHRFISNLIRKKHGERLELGVLKQQELAIGEVTLYKQAQQEYYAGEIKQLSGQKRSMQHRHSAVSRSSKIFKLWPFLDQSGVLRMRGRIGAAPHVPYAAKFPMILPQKSAITLLLVDKFHRRFRHANRETVVNEMRQEFHIPKMRACVGKVARNCMFCRLRKAIPRLPPMAPLPKVRLTPFVRPFSFVGLDYFGPVLVKVGRSNAKRWIALFTCLSIRAVHMEVVHSMSTESCIQAIRRFVSRRGSPIEIFTDNGTNFHGANNQLKKEIEERNQRLASVFTNSNTRWSFNPPGTPHMGGVWERMVRSVKVAIKSTLDESRKPDDETLETVIIEAEGMINTRPLTYIPLESADQEALTPNHFLLGSSSGVKQLAVLPTDYRATLRSSWNLAKHLADEFWRRWITEYLPVISRRCKWFDNVKDFKEGDLVLVVDGTVRSQWTRGRIERVMTGADGRVRQAWVRTNSGVDRRSVTNLALLDVMEDGDPHQKDGSGSRVGECDDGMPPRDGDGLN
ncbi:uncharacterized protein LOC134288863 [Aedes albopictus]|uniref:Uncharacterized protein n=1 Tax=Aedes albopictus TaxID=7160 RepID=A0ABM1YTX5_AEDAL